MKDLQQIKLTDAVGKKIKAVAVASSYHVIAFDDGTFSFFGVNSDYDCQVQEDCCFSYRWIIESTNVRKDGSLYFDERVRLLIRAGVINEDILREDSKHIIDAHLSSVEANERKEYERLKAKFEQVV